MFSPFAKQLFVVSGAALNIVGHGCVHGFPAVLFAQINADPDVDIKLTDHDTSWIGSAIGLTKIIGIVIAPILMGKYGRQKAHMFSTLPALLGWMTFAVSNSVPMFLVARLLHGIAIGLRIPLAAILIAEYCDPIYRGAFIGTFAVSLGIGIFLAHLIGALLHWKITAVVCGVIPIVSLGIISLSPETPSWLVYKGRIEDAVKAFKWLRGDDAEIKELDEIIDGYKVHIKTAVNREAKIFSLNDYLNGLKESLRSLLKDMKKREFYKPTFIALNILIVFEVGGSSMMPAYGNIILKSVLGKKDIADVSWALFVIDILSTLSSFLTIFLLKYFNRRTILFTSGYTTASCLSSISIFIYFREAGFITNTWVLEVVPMTLMVLYILVFCLGVVSIVWVICGEIFPLARRSFGSALATSFFTPCVIVNMKTGPYLFSSIGVEGAFLIYSCVLIVCLSLIYNMLPETKDKTLQEIEDSFKGKRKDDLDVEMSLIDKQTIMVT